MTRRESGKRVELFYRSLSLRSRLRFYAAIFCLFAPVELLSSTSLSDQPPWWIVVGHMVVSGLVAVGWALSVIYDLRLLILVIPGGFAAAILLGHFSPAEPSLISLACVALIVAGYVLFMSFLNREGMSALRLQTEISLAKDVHRQLVPDIHLATPQFEFFGRSVPSTEVGGDLIDAVKHEDSYLLCVADVAGHGVPAGVVMATVKSGLRTALLHQETLKSLLGNLDRIVYDLGGERMFVTCAFVSTKESSAAYAIAGHLPILHYRASAGMIHRLSQAGLPLGINHAVSSRNPRSYEWHSVEVMPGDLLVLLTDGLTEVFDKNGQELGLQALEELLLKHPRAPLSELYELILSTARGHGPQLDDQTVLLARRLA